LFHYTTKKLDKFCLPVPALKKSGKVICMEQPKPNIKCVVCAKEIELRWVKKLEYIEGDLNNPPTAEGELVCPNCGKKYYIQG